VCATCANGIGHGKIGLVQMVASLVAFVLSFSGFEVDERPADCVGE
jgi:hypothetical protein